MQYDLKEDSLRLNFKGYFMTTCPVCHSEEDKHIKIKETRICATGDSEKVTHEAEECRICKVCGVSFFLGIKELTEKSK